MLIAVSVVACVSSNGAAMIAAAGATARNSAVKSAGAVGTDNGVAGALLVVACILVFIFFLSCTCTSLCNGSVGFFRMADIATCVCVCVR